MKRVLLLTFLLSTAAWANKNYEDRGPITPRTILNPGLPRQPLPEERAAHRYGEVDPKPNDSFSAA